jgi:hypothetical protein
MTFDTIMSLLIAGFPLECFILAFLWNIAVRYLPENRLRKLKEFAEDAAQAVEQMHKGGISLTSEEKKQKALESVRNFLKEAHLPIPPDPVTGDLIERSVHLLNAVQSESADKATPVNLPLPEGST